MKLSDHIRYATAAILFEETVLFTPKPIWEPGIRKQIRSVVPFFYPLEQVSPQAFDYVIPLTLADIKYLNEHHQALIGSKTIVPTNDVLDLCNDKLAFCEFFSANGFNDFLPSRDTSTYPYILKKRISEWGIDSIVMLDKEQESQNLDRLNSDEYMAQEFIAGNREFTSHVVIDKRKILMLKTVEFTFEGDLYIKGRDTKPQTLKRVEHGDLLELFESMLNLIDFRGICCINYKITDGRIKIFEINPRYGASTGIFINEVLASFKLALRGP